MVWAILADRPIFIGEQYETYHLFELRQRHLYRAHPDLWQLMLELQDTPNKATELFNRNFTFAELDLRFRLEGEQMSFYDQELEVER